MIPNERFACASEDDTDRGSSNRQVKRDFVHHSNLTLVCRPSIEDHTGS
jgi:hypothetical protein